MSLLLFALTSIVLLSGCASIGAEEATSTPPRRSDVGIRLRPPKMALISSSGEQQPMQGAYFWQAQVEEGPAPAAEIQSPGFAIQDPNPLTVQSGEKLKIEFLDGEPPEQIELRVYPEEGNRGMSEDPRQKIEVFTTTTEPISNQEKRGAPYTWSADLEPGVYFLWLKSTWPNKVNPERPLGSENAFMIEVR